MRKLGHRGAWASCWLLANFAPIRMFLLCLSDFLQLLKYLEGIRLKTSALMQDELEN